MTFFNTFSITLKRPSVQPTNMDIYVLQKQTYMKASEAVQIVADCREQLIKAKGEILGKISQLENADGELTEAQSKIITDLRATVQGVDDIIPDPLNAPGKPTVQDDGHGTAQMETQTENVDLESLTKAELLEKAAAAGIEEVSNSNTKAEIIEALQAKEQK